MKGNIMNSQTSTQQTKAQPNKETAGSAENINAMKCLLKIKTYKINDFLPHFPPFRFRWLRESRLGSPRIARVTSVEELSTLSKNNLKGIILRKRLIWGIHPLTVTFSCPEIITQRRKFCEERKMTRRRV